MTIKADTPVGTSPVPPVDMANLPTDVAVSMKFAPAMEADLPAIAALRSGSAPWADQHETYEQTLEAVTKLLPYIQVGKIQGGVVAYVTVERDGPVPGAAYMRNIVVKPELRKKGLGTALLNHGLQTARDMYRKTIALRVDPANAPAVAFYRKAGFTTVATVVSKKSGKLRLLMSREL